ncbi:MAG TPA: hypothetical protein VII12_05590 [Thermoanaerobaculia bacterium]
MYESRKDKLLSTREFVVRVLQHGGVVLIFVAVTLGIGMLGYHTTAGLPWIDSFLNASMILGGMGPVNAITTTSGKLFAGFYAIFCGLFFVVAAGVLLAPFLHRMVHYFHLEKKGTDE